MKCCPRLRISRRAARRLTWQRKPLDSEEEVIHRRRMILNLRALKMEATKLEVPRAEAREKMRKETAKEAAVVANLVQMVNRFATPSRRLASASMEITADIPTRFQDGKEEQSLRTRRRNGKQLSEKPSEKQRKPQLEVRKEAVKARPVPKAVVVEVQRVAKVVAVATSKGRLPRSRGRPSASMSGTRRRTDNANLERNCAPTTTTSDASTRMITGNL